MTPDDSMLDKTMRPLAATPFPETMTGADLVDHLRHMSLSYATDARRVGAPGSEISQTYALRSTVCDMAARRINADSTKYPTWAFVMLVDEAVDKPCRHDAEMACHEASKCITEYCAPCFARAWTKEYPL